MYVLVLVTSPYRKDSKTCVLWRDLSVVALDRLYGTTNLVVPGPTDTTVVFKPAPLTVKVPATGVFSGTSSPLLAAVTLLNTTGVFAPALAVPAISAPTAIRPTTTVRQFQFNPLT
jgi:hypothetical protein